MKSSRSIPVSLLAFAAWLAAALSSPACSACFGRSNDKMISAYYVGAVLLVGLVTLVLGGITTFFVVIARRASAAGRTARAEQPATPFQS